PRSPCAVWRSISAVSSPPAICVRRDSVSFSSRTPAPASMCRRRSCFNSRRKRKGSAWASSTRRRLRSENKRRQAMQVGVKNKVTTLATVPPARTISKINYPDSDGRPMGETPLHADNLAYLVHMLRMWYEHNEQVFIAGNMFLYYVPGDRLKHVSPDVFVVHGVPKHTNPERRRYLVWEEGGKVPDVVIELTSASTREEDIDDKLAIYRDTIGVKEYFLFDPYEEYMQPSLQGYRLSEGQYHE